MNIDLFVQPLIQRQDFKDFNCNPLFLNQKPGLWQANPE